MGGRNAAITSALLPTKYAKKYMLFVEKTNFLEQNLLKLKQLEKEEKIEPIFNLNITKTIGKNFVEEIENNNKKKTELNRVFVEIRFKPVTFLSKQSGLKTQNRYIVTDNQQKTNVGRVFAAEDIANNKLKQIITARAESAIATTNVHKKLKKERRLKCRFLKT